MNSNNVIRYQQRRIFLHTINWRIYLTAISMIFVY